MTKTNKIKRIFLALFLAALILSALCVGACAEAESAPEASETPEVIPETPETSEATPETPEAKNPFAVFFEEVSSHATEIFSSLSLIVSLILSYAYKRGLVPAVQGAISGLGAAVGKVKESAERTEEESGALQRAVCERLSSAEEMLRESDRALGEILERLDALGSDASDRMRFKTVMEGQIALLYDVFMSSSLPQYKKDEIGERVSRMREELRELDEKSA